MTQLRQQSELGTAQAGGAIGRGQRLALGLLGCLGYAIHAGYHVAQGHPEEALWTCHLGALLVGVGFLARSALWIAVGLLYLTIGLPFWILYLLQGEPFLPTSPLTHILGLVLGIYGARTLGFPRRAWWVAALFVASLIAVSRLVTPEAANINLAYGPMPGWGFDGTPPALHLIGLMVLWCGGLFAVQALLRRLIAPRGE